MACLGVSAGTARADTIIRAQFENNNNVDATTVNYSGVEPDAASADSAFAGSNVWNHLQAGFYQPGSVSFSNLTNSAGTQTVASLVISHINGAYNTGSALPDIYLYSYNSTQTFTFSGLAPDESFSLFLYAYNTNFQPNDRGAIISAGSSSFDTAKGKASSEDSTHAVTGMLTGVTSATGAITGTWAFDSQNAGELGPPNPGEIDWSGFQLAVASPPTAASESSTWMLLAVDLLGLGALLLFGERFGLRRVGGLG